MNILKNITFLENFENDLEHIYKQYLIKNNLNYENNENYFYQYMNFKEREILIKPRMVLESSNLKFEKDIEIKGYKKLKEKIINGEDINPHQSTKVEKSNYIDELFNFEGLVHLHLGDSINDQISKKRKYTKRTKNLAIAMLTDDKAYILSIEPHGENTWINNKYIGILKSEFPEIFKEQQEVEVHSKEIIRSCRELGISYNKIPIMLGTKIRGKYCTLRDQIINEIKIRSESLKEEIRTVENEGTFEIQITEIVSEENGYPKRIIFNVFKNKKPYGRYSEITNE